MISELLEMYRSGAITGYQVMIDCLHMLDPNHPELALGRLPNEVLEEMLEYARRYDPSCMRSNTGTSPGRGPSESGTAMDRVQMAAPSRP